MRFEGVLASWNDERGFGFIESRQGGKEVFVHISAFPSRRGRPSVGQRLTYELELGEGDRLRAKEVELVGKDLMRSAPLPNKASLLWLPAFAVVYYVLETTWGVPKILAALYLVASVVAFVAYAIDKSAAGRGGWRIQESSLLLLGLAGGWPGAILAQVLLRHKSSKTSFRWKFWVTVLLNLGLLYYLCGDQAPPQLRQQLETLSAPLESILR